MEDRLLHRSTLLTASIATLAAVVACRTERVAAPAAGPAPVAIPAPEVEAAAAPIGVSPLYVLDGHRLPRSASDSTLPAVVRALAPADIVSIEVLKGDAARARYGRDGENGVVVITTTARSKS